MKKWSSVVWLVVCLVVVGCGSEATNNVATSADAQAIADYEAAQAESQKQIAADEKQAGKPAR
ncbi:hypothetical protein [Allorhodopirellula heiligendammensis]|uniref:Secreted protein n=1 Tax=Allorhodopirellula heiligendammensis TaxID=2714739 RepID=A0A5C6C887_9BACT|nr:hypothetical protein [Allorhodopirellula heiligendammensis]TWU19646.1 hypothetical protein Poly21_18210 [Allorhodopirellula heiligendammensis]